MNGSKIQFDGQFKHQPLIRVGYVGCGGHSRRNVLPSLKYASVEPVAICARSIEKASIYAKEFGFAKAYAGYEEMLAKEELDAVFICTNNDENMRPIYSKVATACLEAGCHVWLEKPPAATSAELKALKLLAEKKNLQVMTAFKKMFFPVMEKAKELSLAEEFGGTVLCLLQYPLYLPTVQELQDFHNMKPIASASWFLDQICHPVSLMLDLMGHPKSLIYTRSRNGSGIATFSFENGSVASLALHYGAAVNGGMEFTQLISAKGRHISVYNNTKLTYHRDPPNLGYGVSPSYYAGSLSEVSSVWEPEFSFGQLYNNSLFLMGYYGEIEYFAQALINKTPAVIGGIDDSIMSTKIFEAFTQGPNKVIDLK